MTKFQGAILSEQLKRVESQNARRHQNATYLNGRPAEIPGIRPLAQRDYATKHSHHIYIFLFGESSFGIFRREFIDALGAEGTPCSGSYAHPLHKNPMFLSHDFYPRDCPFCCGRYSRETDYASFADICPSVERAWREAVWLEHRLLVGSKGDVEDFVRAISNTHERLADFKTRQTSARKQD